MSNDQRVNLQQLASSLNRQSTLSPNEAENFITQFFDVIRESLVAEKIVKVRGLGTFKLVDVEPRESIKVGTGERFIIEGHSKVTFTPDPVLRDAVNRPFADFETVVVSEGVDLAALEATEPTELPVEDEPVDATDLPVDEPAEPSDVATTKDSVELSEVSDEGTAQEESDDDLSDEADDETDDEPVDVPVDESVDVPADEPVDELVVEPVVEPVDEPVDEPSIESNDQCDDNSLKPKGSPVAVPLVGQPTGDEPDEVNDEPEPQTPQSQKPSLSDEAPASADEKSTHVKKAAVVSHADVVEVANYVRHSDNTSHRHRRWTGCLFGLLCLILGYVIGCYFPVKMPTLISNEQIVNFLQYINHKIDDFSSSLETKQDTIQVVDADVQDVGVPESKFDSKSDSKPDKPKAATSASTDSKPVAKSESKSSVPVKSSRTNYPQLQGGAYEIVGVEAVEAMTAGKTLLNLSIKYYGSKDFVDYICVMNGITNPDIVPLNKELRIPALQMK